MIIVHRTSPDDLIEAVNIEKLYTAEIVHIENGFYHILINEACDDCAEVGCYETLEQAEKALVNMAIRFSRNEPIATTEAPTP